MLKEMHLMKKFLSTIKAKLDTVCQKAAIAATDIATDVEGSDTTEKIGMVVVAVVIVGLLAAAVNRFMPGLFDAIGEKAQNILMDTFN